MRNENSVFRNSADNHTTDIIKARRDLDMLIGDFGLPDVLAMLADCVENAHPTLQKTDSGVRRVCETRAAIVRMVSEGMR